MQRLHLKQFNDLLSGYHILSQHQPGKISPLVDAAILSATDFVYNRISKEILNYDKLLQGRLSQLLPK
jgi:hypothetical protein